MAHHKLCNMYLTLIVFLEMSPGSMSSNFPIQNCTTGKFDILQLTLSTTVSDRYIDLHLCKVFACDSALSQDSTKSRDQSSPHEKAEPRIRYASVLETTDVKDRDINISSWGFQSLEENPEVSIEKRSYYYPVLALQGRPVEKITDLRIKFVQRLFSEMSGVRENATHIAILYIRDALISYDEIRNISHTVQQSNINIKIFVLMTNTAYNYKIVHLDDLLLIPFIFTKEGMYTQQMLSMAMCRQCASDDLVSWFPFEHNNGMHLLSCYWMTYVPLTPQLHDCRYFLLDSAAIETLEELSFLQVRLVSEIKKSPQFSNTSSNFSVYIDIGLKRNSKSISRRFQWEIETLPETRPLVINHWLPGKPDGGFNNNVGMWQFTEIWNNNNNDSDINQNFSRSLRDEGWVDTTRDTKLLPRFSLCEVVLAKKSDDTYTVRLKPANADIFNKTLLTGDFMKFGDNIVSVSAHVASTKFLQFLKETETDFPIFDCGEDADQPRYISYTFVCDYVDHCTNRRDETSCLKTPDRYYRACDSGEIISYSIGRCDGINDCQDGSDEKYCTGKNTGKFCIDGSRLQIQWLNDGEIDCIFFQDVNDENLVHNNYLQINKTCAFICNNDQTCVRLSQLNDGNKDCVGAEGPLDETIGKLEPANTCYNLLGDVIWAPKCVYIRDRYGAVLGCRDMSHLQDCLDYKCVEGYVKCYMSYCIPQHYVLDGQGDCPLGEEEEDFNAYPCSGNFACWDSKVCLHPHLVCNGYPDCPHKDDELNCGVMCPDGCRCVSGTVTVSDYNRTVPLENLGLISGARTRYLDLSGLDLSRINSFDHNVELLNKVVKLNWSRCNISILHFIGDSRHMIETLDISYNLIQNFVVSEAMTFSLENVRHLNLSYNNYLVLVKNLQFLFLEIIDLSHTGLSYLDDSFFLGLPKLRHLNLSYTFISHFYKNMFPSQFILQTLDLHGIPIENFNEGLFGGLTINQDLYTDKFEMCCPQIRGKHIQYYSCHGPEDAISSCFDLVGGEVQRVLLWVVAFLAVLGNMTVIAYRVIWDRSVLRTGYGLLVTNLGISDLIMGAYLLIITGADYYYRGNYVLHHTNWRESYVCQVAGFLATLSSEVSKFFVLLITLDRFLVIKFPFGQIQFSNVSKYIAMFLCWCLGFIISIIPTIFKFEINSSNAMCLGLPLTNQRLKGWEYSFGVYIVLNFVMFLIIACGQISIFRAMSDNRITRTASVTSTVRRVEDILVAKQLSLVVMSDFVCWFPIGVMGLLSLGGHEIINDVYAWTTVLILPINSAVNPLLYTMSALMTAWKKYRYGHINNR